MVELGYQQGAASPCVFVHPERNVMTSVHGDDFTMISPLVVQSVSLIGLKTHLRVDASLSGAGNLGRVRMTSGRLVYLIGCCVGRKPDLSTKRIPANASACSKGYSLMILLMVQRPPASNHYPPRSTFSNLCRQISSRSSVDWPLVLTMYLQIVLIYNMLRKNVVVLCLHLGHLPRPL